ncbi:MAG: branched-chain amino acid transport system substrate-binding protein, partial [Caballeronia sp.]|nr:branched-chain amino acid transport system substrate-binding protein [Caballeronia sp.]
MKRRNLVVAIALGIMGAHVPSYGAEPEVVKIGFAAPLTGPVARVGKDLQYGAQLALDEENAKNP